MLAVFVIANEIIQKNKKLVSIGKKNMEFGTIIVAALTAFLTKSGGKVSEKIGEDLWEKVKKLFSVEELVTLNLEEEIKDTVNDTHKLEKIISLLEKAFKDNEQKINPEVKNEEIKTSVAKYLLLEFRTYPLVKSEDIPRIIIDEVSNSISINDAESIVSEANRFRKQANPNEEILVIKLNGLPSIHHAGSSVYWQSVFGEARRHGPRMLAALLLTIPDSSFGRRYKIEKEKLLELLKNYSED